VAYDEGRQMKGYTVVTSDDAKVGHVVGEVGENLIVEHGHLMKSRRPLPRAFAHADDDGQIVRTTVSKAILEDAPKVEADGSDLDEAEVARYYGLAAGDPAPETQGDGAMRPDDPARSIELMQSAVEQLEALPFPPQAARIRRRLAGAFVEVGDRDEGMRQLRKAHDVFARVGATVELEGTREEMRELGLRPPPKSVTSGAAGLTGREIEIARMVATRKSNKEIGGALQISARTVSTHLSNIFLKLSVGSRGELADFVRQNGLLEQ
jgi:DNA-binding CsgD family transcriptional regulator